LTEKNDFNTSHQIDDEEGSIDIEKDIKQIKKSKT